MTCRHFGICGGCSVPGVAYAEQLARKQAQMRRWFPHVPPGPLVPSPNEHGFRQKVAFVFATDRRSGRLLMGHYQAGSRRLVPVEECPVHSDRGNRLAFALRDHLVASHVPPGILRHVVIRTSEDGREAVAMLVVSANHKTLRRPVRALLEGPEPPDGLFVSIHDRPDGYMIGRDTMRIAGRDHVREDVLGTRFLISPTAFFQTNIGAARELLRLVLEHAGGTRRVIDLYSGSGLFALPLARGGARVVAVEENRQAMSDAEANLRLNRMPAEAVRLVTRRVEDALSGLRREPAEVIVLDPPRQGCPSAVIDRVCDIGAPRLVYVSCNPERLAAESGQFRARGYVLAAVQAVDMFPHTEHMEAVALFTRAEP